MEDVRECRVRSEFAHLYEEHMPEVWVPARDWAERLDARARKARLLSIHRRTLDEAHFDFRGGGRPAHLQGAQSRRDDHKSTWCSRHRHPPAQAR